VEHGKVRAERLSLHDGLMRLMMRILKTRHRPPVVIFVSDSEGDAKDEVIYDVCCSAVGKGFVGFHRKLASQCD
jgi:hypothetical protein